MANKWIIEDHSKRISADYTIISKQGGGFPDTVAHVPAYYLGNIGQKRAAQIAAVPIMLEALNAAKERFEVLMDADEATDNDVEVYGLIDLALGAAAGKRAY